MAVAGLYLGDEAEIDEGELVLRLVVEAQHVARVGIRVEEADLRAGTWWPHVVRWQRRGWRCLQQLTRSGWQCGDVGGARLQQLHEEALLADLDQLLDLFRRAIRQLHAVDPLRDENLARRQVVVDGGHEHVLHLRPRTKR